jgi:hypothetical protein
MRLWIGRVGPVRERPGQKLTNLNFFGSSLEPALLIEENAAEGERRDDRPLLPPKG